MEIMVVIALIALLTGMVLSAVFRALDSSRSLECKNNLKQLGTAMMSYVVAYQVYPAYVKSEDEKVENNLYVDSWVAALFNAKKEGVLELDAALFLCPNGTEYGAKFSDFGKPQAFDEDFGSLSYGYNIMLGKSGFDRKDGKGIRRSSIAKPSMTAVLYDADHHLGGAAVIKWDTKDKLDAITVEAVDGLMAEFGQKEAVYFRHIGSVMNILMADSSVQNWTLQSLLDDAENLDASSNDPFGSIWDNAKILK